MRASHFIKWLDNEDLDLVEKKFGGLEVYHKCAMQSIALMWKLRHTRSMDYLTKIKIKIMLYKQSLIQKYGFG